MGSWHCERDLLDRARRGDREAFDQVTTGERKRLRQLITRRLGRKLHQSCAVDDVCQETFLRAYRSIGDFVPRHPDSFFRWLASISRNVVHEIARGTARRPLIAPLNDALAPDLSPSRTLRREERYDRLQLALARLPPDHREVIHLIRLEKLSCRDAGERMGRSEVATRSLLWRALRALKDEFGDTESLTLPQESPTISAEHQTRRKP